MWVRKPVHVRLTALLPGLEVDFSVVTIRVGSTAAFNPFKLDEYPDNGDDDLETSLTSNSPSCFFRGLPESSTIQESKTGRQGDRVSDNLMSKFFSGYCCEMFVS